MGRVEMREELGERIREQRTKRTKGERNTETGTGWKSVWWKRDEREEREGGKKRCREGVRATRERFNQTNAYK